jgi:UDP-arabinose 4-epimerase
MDGKGAAIMKGDKVLVTGGAGYVGSHACKALADAGFVPVTYDNLSRGHRWAVRFGPFEEGDILDRSRLDAVLSAYSPVAILHFVAFSYVGESVEKPELYQRINVTGSLNLIDAALRAGVRRFVFSSTCAVYGTPERVPITEDMPFAPINPYGETKAAVERALAAGAEEGRLSYVALRYFNAAGAAPEAGIGEDHDPESHLIPLAIGAAAGLRPPLTVFGGDYDTPDGTCVRDYIHVLDLADAHVRALGHLLDGGKSLRLNLGTGRGYSVREIIAATERVTGRVVPHEMGDRRVGDPPVLVADASAAASALGWSAARPDIDGLISDAWAWHQVHILDSASESPPR